MTTVVDETQVVPADQPVSSSASALYRAIWRWHFYAGLFVAPFIMMFAVTGLLYMLQPQIHALMDGDKLYIKPQAMFQPYTQQLAAAQTAYAGAEVTQFRPNRAANRSSEVLLADVQGRDLVVFVDPYTARVLGERDTGRDITELAVGLHGDLLAGDTGDRILEIAAGWGVVLVATGVYLWWPRTGSAVWGTLLPRLSRRNQRLLARSACCAGLLCIAHGVAAADHGMTWTGVWGDRFASVWSQYPAQMWDEVPTSTQLSGVINSTGEKIVPWAAEQLPLPLSSVGDHAEHADHAGHSDMANTATPAQGIPAGTPVDLDSVIALARSMNVVPTFVVSLTADEQGVYTVTVSTANFSGSDARDKVTTHIDQYSGAVFANVGWNDYGIVPKVVSMGNAIHEGKQFGIVNQAVIVLACVVVLLAVSGVVLWWQRRPAGRLGHRPNLVSAVHRWPPSPSWP